MSLNPLEILALMLMGAALLLGLLRLIIGPRSPDRIIAADTMSVITTTGLAGMAIVLGSSLYLDVALIYGVLAFVAVVAIARAIEGSRA
ncbi:MAG: monovalent cation/H+ antiporter complex subunit F [Chromatiaceae bacterium]|jgi:multicomponent Na+:H+ antiporter subunit F